MPESPTPDDTWTDDDEAAPVPRQPVVLSRELSRHRASMQTKVLIGVGGVILVTLLLVVFGPAFGAISEDYARDILQSVLPATLAAGATIVGTLFGSERHNDH